MAEPLKNIYNREFIEQFSEKVCGVYREFNSEGFITNVMDETWEELELKGRMSRITEVLGKYLPQKYEEALGVLFSIDESCTGFPYLFFPEFVATYGLSEEYWELSMAALERFTKGSSSEFAIRPFLLKNPERVLEQMRIWAMDTNEHVRRLASEGCRPRLPWGMALPIFKKDPAPVLSVLEQLKADSSLYVRKSVANNLNDIAKDNPAAVLETVRRWKGNHPYTDWILRQGCRTMIRKADAEAMELFGYAKPEEGQSLAVFASLSVKPAVLIIGEECELEYQIDIRQGEPAHIRIEYGIDFVKAKGNTSRKLFLLSDKTVEGGAKLSGTRTHSWANLTTRRHYAGDHKIVILLNGIEVASTSLQLNLV